VELTPEMVHCEPTPARVVLELVDYAGLTSQSIFYDLGSGLGQVAILVNLLTGVRSKGVEVDPVLCGYARQCATRLGLPNVTFVQGDARTVNYDDGTHFFLFTPFRGMILQTVLARLQTIAQQRPLTICTYGPCTPTVAQQGWLRAREYDGDHTGDHEYKLAIFTSD
jgi:SAM-dependent methyltransferase